MAEGVCATGIETSGMKDTPTMDMKIVVAEDCEVKSAIRIGIEIVETSFTAGVTVNEPSFTT